LFRIKPFSPEIHFVTTTARRATLSRSAMNQLTKREKEVLAALSRGPSYKEIAAVLGISLNTVRTHLKQVYSKLGVRSRTAATVRLLRARL
jgi:DNA-binding NarL/FixJ family response regulator